MAQTKILDKEKDYLLSVNAQQFVDSLNSASIFYELLSYDTLGTLKERKEAFMAQTKILDKEKDYLLSVNAQQFVDSLNSASIFYELLSYDTLGTLKERKEAKTSYNNITLVGVYNYLLNLVCYNMYEGLSFRHHILYMKQDEKLELNSIWLNISSINYLDEEIQRLTNKNGDIFQEYKYVFASSWNKAITINDKINFSLRTYSIFEHSIQMTKQQISDDFLSKMLILYQDFADNIPI